jgi:hypothetical protein
VLLPPSAPIASDDRTRLIRGVACVLCLTVLIVAWRAASGSAEAYPDKPLVKAQSARAFGDSVGVNVRLHLTNSAGYGNFATIKSRLLELGVRHIGDGLCHNCPAHLQRLEALGAAGIKVTLGVGNQTEGALRDARLAVVRDRLLGAVEAIAGPNEVDYGGDPDWIANTRAYQAELYSRVKGDPKLRHLAVIGPSLVYRQSRAALGNLSASLDRGNIHPYPAGVPPMTDLALEFQLAGHVSGSKPLVATETGYHDDTAFTGVHRGASERAVGYYTPRSVLEAFRAGIERTFLFQLADAWSPAQQAQYGFSDQHNSFGLLRSDQSPKPGFTALRNLMRAVDSDSAPVESPGGLRYGLEGAGPDVRQLLLRSADGSFALVLWRTVSVWDRDARKDLYPGADSLEVVLGERIGTAQRFDPVVSDAQQASWDNPRRIPVDVGGGPVVLRLTPAGQAPAQHGEKHEQRRLVATPRRQSLRRFVVVRVPCVNRCARVTAKGKLIVSRKRGRKPRRFALKPDRAPSVDGKARLRLRIPPRGRRAARSALKQGRTVRAVISITGRAPRGARLWTARKRIVLRLP